MRIRPKIRISRESSPYRYRGIASLIDRDRLRFDTTIKEIFGDTLPCIAPEATVDQLLCHTSGVYDYYDEEIITNFDNFRVDIPWCLLETPSDYFPLLRLCH